MASDQHVANYVHGFAIDVIDAWRVGMNSHLTGTIGINMAVLVDSFSEKASTYNRALNRAERLYYRDIEQAVLKAGMRKMLKGYGRLCS